jgi:predicted amidohydrolase
MRDIRVAAGMMRAEVGDVAGNIRRMQDLAGRAAEAGAEVLVLPEACLTGYTVRESMAEWASPVPGPLTDSVCQMADQHNMLIFAGLVEQGHNGACYLTQLAAAPEGLLDSYRKTHLGPTEQTLFGAGDRLTILDWRGVRFGLQLCYEGHFPEMSTALALRGAEVMVIPHASPRETPEEKLERWRRYMPARGYDNTAFIVSVNQAGENGAGLTFAGVALISGVKGEILAQAAGYDSQIIAADLSQNDLETVKEGRMGYFLPLRRPELYELD